MSDLFKVGDHAILMNGRFNDFHGVGWVEISMAKMVGTEFIIREIIRKGIDNDGVEYQSVYLDDLNGDQVPLAYDSAWLIHADADFDTTAIDEMFNEMGVL